MIDTHLIDRVREALHGLGLETLTIEPTPGIDTTPADGVLRIGKGDARLDFVVETRRAVTPATLGAILAQLGNLAAAQRRPTLLLTDYITPQVADKLHAQAQQFADAAGNAYLEGPGLLIYVTGRKPQDARAAPKTDQTLTTNGLKILFALICDPALAAAPQRQIALAAGVALGAVPGVFADLQALGHLLVAGKNRRLNVTKRLLDEWAFTYARRLRPKTLNVVFATPNFAQWREWKLDPKEAQWGGEPAANLLVGHLVPGVLTIYAVKPPPRLIVEQRMHPIARVPQADPYVEFRVPFWGKTLHTDTRPDTVPPALVYADLLATGDARCIETAKMVYDDCLARLLPAQ